MFNEDFISTMVDNYLVCALWADLREEDEELNLAISDFSDEIWEKAMEDCTKLCQIIHISGMKEEYDFKAKNLGQAFWLTRQGHGAGFWDGRYPESIGKRLDKITEDNFHTLCLYVKESDMLPHIE